jgi:hypothetical protein
MTLSIEQDYKESRIIYGYRHYRHNRQDSLSRSGAELTRKTHPLRQLFLPHDFSPTTPSTYD